MMPRITLSSPFGVTYRCDTMNEDTLRAWFDEILPQVNPGDPAMPPARISVHPMWRHVDEAGRASDADWSLDSRVISWLYGFPHRTGAEAIAALPGLRATLERLAGV